MRIEPFALERYFAKHEFSARFLLSSSDCEPMPMAELLDLAEPGTRRLWEDLTLAYTESPGHPLLRREIAGLYEGLTPDDVLVVVPEEGIFLLMHALLEPGDRVVCVAPAYQSLHEVARSIGCEVSAWEPREADGWRFEPDDLELLLRDEPKLVVLNFPHNPTGAVPRRDEIEAMVAAADRRGAVLLSDEMYRGLDIAPGSLLPSAVDLGDRTVVLDGLSKRFGLPGLRIGWVATRDRGLLERMAVLKDCLLYTSDAADE